METFRKTLRGTIKSSQGFHVHLSGRTTVTYADGYGKLVLQSEAMAGPGIDLVIYSDTIPDMPERPRRQILDDIQRAFTFAGWTLEIQD